MGYLRTTILGVSWSVALRWVTRGLSIVRIGFLARILTPAQFGIFGIATLVLGFLEMFTETWINVFLVQEKDKIDRYVDTAWVVSIIRGLLMSVIIFLFAPTISGFFGSPQSLPALQLMSVVPIIRGFINPSIVRLQKDLLFRHEFLFKSGLFLVDAVVSISLALITKDPTSLVWGMIASGCLEITISFLLFRPTPRFHLNIATASRVIHRSKWMTVAGILAYLYQNGDNFVVGKMLGEASLGLYSSAYKISSMPISEVSDVIARVTFPIFVKISDNKERLQKAFSKTTFLVSGISVIIGLGVYLFADPIVSIILGPGWIGVVPVLQVLSIYGVSKSIVNSTYPLFLATKNQNYVTIVTAISTICLAIFIVPLIQRFGLIGAGYAAIIGSLAAVPVSLVFVKRVFQKYEKTSFIS